MTTAGNAKTYNSAVTNTTIDLPTEFKAAAQTGLGGLPDGFMNHTGFWLHNVSVTAAEIIWWRNDTTAATVAGNDCYPLMAGERVYIGRTKSLSFIAASGTPGLCVAGDQSQGIIYS